MKRGSFVAIAAIGTAIVAAVEVPPSARHLNIEETAWLDVPHYIARMKHYAILNVRADGGYQNGPHVATTKVLLPKHYGRLDHWKKVADQMAYAQLERALRGEPCGPNTIFFSDYDTLPSQSEELA